MEKSSGVYRRMRRLFFSIRFIIIGRCSARLDHLRDHMIELRGVCACDHRSSETLFKIPPGIPGNGSAGLCDSFIGIESLGLLLLREFACDDFNFNCLQFVGSSLPSSLRYVLSGCDLTMRWWRVMYEQR